MILNWGFLGSAALDADADTEAETVALTDADIDEDMLVVQEGDRWNERPERETLQIDVGTGSRGWGQRTTRKRVRMSQMIGLRRKGSMPFDSDDYELDRCSKHTKIGVMVQYTATPRFNFAASFVRVLE
jgi:hypothetical protein